MSLRFALSARRRAGVDVALIALVGIVLVLMSNHSAWAAGGSSLGGESFTGSATTTPNWFLPTSEGGVTIVNTACLTASADVSATPIPGCSGTAVDAGGSGVLRLTTNATNQVGTVYSTVTVPTSKGVDIKFVSYQWSKNAGRLQAGDGVALVLAATDPANPRPPAVLAANGGALGYASNGTIAGVSYGYLGLGLDVYGNFSYVGYGHSCPGANEITGTNSQVSNSSYILATANSVTVRGPGNGTTGYCEMPTTADTGNAYLAGYSTSRVASGSLLDAPNATSRPGSVPVEIAINSDSMPAITGSGLSVPARSWLVSVTPLGGVAQQMTGALPTAAELLAVGYPASWISPTTGLPQRLSFGFSASTGGSAEYHEVANQSIATLDGPLPSYAVTVTDNPSGSLTRAAHAIASITSSLTSAGGSEAEATTVTTTFPAAFTPPSTTFSTAAGYVCTPAAQVVTCLYMPTAAVPAGTAYPALLIPFTVSTASNAGTYTITTTVSSADGAAASAAHSIDVIDPVTKASGPTLAMTGQDDGAALLPLGGGGTLVGIALLLGSQRLRRRARSR